LIHINIWGPFGVHSIHDHKFFLTIVDDYTRHTWVVLMKSKNETGDLINNFVFFIKNQFDKNIKIIRTDNGHEFCWQDFYDRNGIIHQTSCVETPQQNSVVERKHQHILNVACGLMFQSNLPKVFWSYAILHAVHLINRLLSHVIHNQSPFEILYGDKPDLSNLKIFGCICFASTLEHNRSKLDPRARKCIFLGLKKGNKGYMLIDVNNREIFISKNVIFHEHTLCRIIDNHDKESSDHSNITIEPIHDDFEFDKNQDNVQQENTKNETSVENLESPNLQEENDEEEVFDENLRRSTRTHRASAFLKDYHQLQLSSHKNLQETNKVRYPFDSILSYKSLSDEQLKYTLSLSTQNEPQTFEEVIQDVKWVKAIQTKIQALEANNTWKIVDLPPVKTPIGCRWVYKIKRKANGDVK